MERMISGGGREGVVGAGGIRVSPRASEEAFSTSITATQTKHKPSPLFLARTYPLTWPNAMAASPIAHSHSGMEDATLKSVHWYTAKKDTACAHRGEVQ